MPHIAGKWKSWCIITAENIVNAPSPITTLPPFLMVTLGSVAGSKCGLPAGTMRTSKNAVTSQPINEAGKSAKKSIKGALPAAHAIRVVISPNGLHAPPAFAVRAAFRCGRPSALHAGSASSVRCGARGVRSAWTADQRRPGDGGGPAERPAHRRCRSSADVAGWRHPRSCYDIPRRPRQEMHIRTSAPRRY